MEAMHVIELMWHSFQECMHLMDLMYLVDGFRMQ